MRVDDIQKLAASADRSELEKLVEHERWRNAARELPLAEDESVLVLVSGSYDNAKYIDAVKLAVHFKDGWMIEGLEDWETPEVSAWRYISLPWEVL